MPLRSEASDPEITVSDFVERASDDLSIELLCDSAILSLKHLNSARVQKLGLALSGFAEKVHAGRLQIFGKSEASYMARIGDEAADEAVRNLDRQYISCILVTNGLKPPPKLASFAAAERIPLMRTPLASSRAIAVATGTLETMLSPRVTVHGVLMNIFGFGVLIIGESGIGKSECALELIGRGHRLVSDDSVTLNRIGERIAGCAPDLTRDHVEIRGLGVIDVRELFGMSALSAGVDVEFCLEFAASTDGTASDRLGLESIDHDFLGLSIPKYMLPVRPGRNLATLAETAVRVFLSRKAGSNATMKLIETHAAMIAGQK